MAPIGDYPRLPVQYTALKDPFGYWDKQGRRNYGEILQDHDLFLDEWSVGPLEHWSKPMKQHAKLWAAMGVFVFGIWWWDPESHMWWASIFCAAGRGWEFLGFFGML